MVLSKENTEVILKNMRSEGHSSRADYIELMQQRIAELEQREAELAAHVERLRDALEPFACRSISDCISREDYSVMRERVKDWMGVKDFKKAKLVFESDPTASLNPVRREVASEAFDRGYEDGYMCGGCTGEEYANDKYPDKE